MRNYRVKDIASDEPGAPSHTSVLQVVTPPTHSHSLHPSEAGNSAPLAYNTPTYRHGFVPEKQRNKIERGVIFSAQARTIFRNVKCKMIEMTYER